MRNFFRVGFFVCLFVFSLLKLNPKIIKLCFLGNMHFRQTLRMNRQKSEKLDFLLSKSIYFYIFIFLMFFQNIFIFYRSYLDINDQNLHFKNSMVSLKKSWPQQVIYDSIRKH